MSVLVVGDHETSMQTVRTLLRQLGLLDVEAADNFADALGMMKRKRYGLIITHWCTAPTNSCDFIRGVRSDPGLNRTACIMTGEQKPENVIAAKKAGVNSYIVEPFTAETLKAKIEAALVTKTATFSGPDPAVAESQPPPSSKAQASVATPAPATLKCRGIFTNSL